ncbi:hypothetical protein M406DRAFT_320090 [Cryphonectria parasitica EP155]|uniref:Uncharacterized protein n=1 Tax=Cryphonectria parasitica (strain ATCC 38755 / EP155) TaxID=660469 RepID=A0A9P5CT28_CRYP1|nr:uncharacterized protein M406DRAFT_320090 [Cryphonectria parasitica EP155]KAF3769893.1 hypothetical protein M406DRAFT_320090 [Cryphonectria parasitica EP155]
MASKKTKSKVKTASGTVGAKTPFNEPLSPQPTRSEPTAGQASRTIPQTSRDDGQVEASDEKRSTNASRAIFQDNNKLEKQSQHTSAGPEEDNDEGFFAFDDEEETSSSQKTRAARSRTEKYLTEAQDDEPENVEYHNNHTKATRSHSGGRGSPPTNASTGSQPAITVPAQHPTKPEGTRSLSTSIGSYAGRPVMPGPVKDQELLKKLESVDSDVPFFVGSVNGRSGPDASNVKSYQEQGFSYDSDKDEAGDNVEMAAKKTR